MKLPIIETADCLQLIIAVISIVGSVFAAWLTVNLTVCSERKTLILTIKRNLYMDVYKHLSKLKKNPTLIFEQDFMDAFYDLSIQVEVYADKSMQKVFNSFYDNAISKYLGYVKKFLEDNIYQQRKEIVSKSPLFSEQFEKEEYDYKIQNMCDMEALEALMQTLRKKLAEEE